MAPKHSFRWDQLSPDEARLLRVLLPHRGREQAVSVPVVADQLGMHQRAAQTLVKALIEDHLIPIGSSTSSRRPGWYLIVCDEERKENRRALRGRALSILKRARAYDPRNNNRLAELFQGQQQLPFGGRRG